MITGSDDPIQASRWFGRAGILTFEVERGAGCRGAHEDCSGVGSDSLGFGEGANGCCIFEGGFCGGGAGEEVGRCVRLLKGSVGLWE